MSLLDEIVKEIKKEFPEFNEKDPIELAKMIKVVALASKDNPEKKEIYNKYLLYVEKKEREATHRVIGEKKYERTELIHARQTMLELEQEVLNIKFKVLREFMD